MTTRRESDRGSLLPSTMGSPQHRYPLRHKRGKVADADVDGASPPARPPVAPRTAPPRSVRFSRTPRRFGGTFRTLRLFLGVEPPRCDVARESRDAARDRAPRAAPRAPTSPDRTPPRSDAAPVPRSPRRARGVRPRVASTTPRAFPPRPTVAQLSTGVLFPHDAPFPRRFFPPFQVPPSSRSSRLRRRTPRPPASHPLPPPPQINTSLP